jgi:hypothetical protein
MMPNEAKKITVEIPEELLARAQKAASEAYSRLRGMRGKVQFTRTLEELKDDR